MIIKALLFLLVCHFEASHPQDDICKRIVEWDSTKTKQFIEKEYNYYNAYLEWQYYKNGDATAEDELNKEKDIYNNFREEMGNDANKFLERKDEIKQCNNETLLKVLKHFEMKSDIELDADESKELNQAEKQVLEYFKGSVDIDGKNYTILSGLLQYMKQRDYTKLLRGWQVYHDDVEVRVKDDYLKIVELQNKLAKKKGYADLSEEWLDDEFDDTTIDNEHILRDIFPLYTKIHAYARSKLFDYYKEQVADAETKAYLSNKRNPIPAHIFGDMIGQQWKAISDLVMPFPEEKPIDIEQILIDKKYDARKLFKLSEEFFTSLGFEKMTDIFWEKSIIERNNPRMMCAPNANDMIRKDDFRIFMCTEMNDMNFYMVHHEMGHIVNFMSFRSQPYIWRGTATQAFDEAVGDTIVLSARSRKHLKAIGFIEEDDQSDAEQIKKQRINDLMEKALVIVIFIPFSFVLEKWRFSVFKGETQPNEFNKKWWDMRLKYNGLSAPLMRPEGGFDVGAKFHISLQIPFFRYFYSFVGQFQFHEALCRAAGQEEDLLDCDIYNSKEAGDKLKAFLSAGRSRSWKELMKEFTGTENFESTAISNYFKPLDEWLTKYLEDNAIPIGWDGMYEV